MPALDTFEPLRAETIDTIRARVDASVNLGLDLADNRWQDTTPGHWWWDHMQTVGLELELVWDFASAELPASFFLPYSWGIYLDYWGAMLAVPRNPAVVATGTVTFSNPTADGVLVGTATEVAVPSSDPSLDGLTFQTTDTVTVPAGGTIDATIISQHEGSEYNVAANAITQITSPGLDSLTVTNANAITGGADEELDEPFKARLLLEFTGTRGGGTPDDYIAETIREFPTVGYVVVQRAWAGPNTVRLVISDHNNQQLDPTIVTAVQAYWDDAAPIGATVTVATVVDTGYTVTAEITPRDGYSLDGADGGTPLRDSLVAAIQTYTHTLGAGDTVQHNRVLAALLDVQGVYEVPALTLNGAPGDVAMSPLDAAMLTLPPTLTQTP